MQLSNVRRWLSFSLALSAAAYAQQPNGTTAVPPLIRLSGSHRGTGRTAQPAVVGATFTIYRQANDGTPLWSETQNVQLDQDGNYTVLLGSTRAEGMPVDLFSMTESRWLEVEIDQAKQPRILLVSVPYALKSADADTLGGLPPSAYLRASLRASPSTSTSTANGTTNLIVSPLANAGTPGCIGLFSDTTDLICSTITQSTVGGSPAVSVGGSAALGALTLTGNVPSGDAAGMALYNVGGGAGASVSLDMYNTQANGGIPQAKIKAIDDGAYSDHLTFWTKTPGAANNPVTEKVRITSAGNVGIGTSTPSQKLEVAGTARFDNGIMYGDGTTQSTATLTGPQGTTGATGPAGPTGPQGPAGPAGSPPLSVLDANNNVLGTLVGFSAPFGASSNVPNGVIVYKSGYFITVQFNGQFPVGFTAGNNIFWSGTNCTGTGYLSAGSNNNPLTSSRLVSYSGQNNALYVPSGSSAAVTATSAASALSIESTNIGGCTNGSFGQYGWPLTPFNAATTLGWTVSGNPLSVAGPIKFQ